MSRWEYKLVSHQDVERAGLIEGRKREAIEQYFNDLGADGWEIIGIDFVDNYNWQNFVGIAKRERR